MKRIISILMIVAMMLTALMAVIPASATEGGTDPAPVTYKVNWKRHYDKTWMRGQWYNDNSDAQNKYETGFKIIADNNSISSEFKSGSGHNYSYYSTKMFDITADTSYEYTFKAKNNADTTKAGVIFAYAGDATKGNLDDYPYFVYGSFQNKCSEGDTAYLSFIKGHPTKSDGKINNDIVKPVLKLDNGYGQFKVIYQGLTVKFFYLDFATNTYMQAGSDITLPAGSKVCFGVYSGEGTEQNTLTLKDCTLTVLANDTQKAVIGNTAFNEYLTAAKAITDTTKYTSATATALATAISEADGVVANNEAVLNDYVVAANNLDAAINGLKVKADMTALDAALAEAKSKRASDYSNISALTAAITAAEAVKAQTEPDQTAVDAAVKAINDAIKALTTTKKNLLYIGTKDKVKEMGYNGQGNVFYFDYHKYVADKKYTPGAKFPTDLETAGDAGNKKYVLRMADGGNVDGTGTAQACDGVVENYGDFSHQVNNNTTATINGKAYPHAFGFSFYKAVTADEIAFYLPTNTSIKTIDVYGAMRVTEADGTVLYGKELDANKEVAPRVLLGTIDVTAAKTENGYKVARGYLNEARKLEYIFFALEFTKGVGDYAINEIELYGLDDTTATKPADFTKLMAQMDIYRELVENEYTPETWATVKTAIETHKATIQSVFASQPDIDAAAKALDDAIKALKLAQTPDKTKLAAAITEAEKLVADKAKYKPETWTPFEKALTKAKEVNAGNIYPQSQVDKALKALEETKITLIKIGDKTALKAAIDTAKTYTKDKYSGDAMKWGLFENALAAAEKVYADENADQTQVDDAKAKLESTQSKLVASEPEAEDKGDNAGDTTNPDAPGASADGEVVDATEEATEGEGEESTDEGKKKKCGSSVALSALAIVGVFGTALVIKKRD